MGKSKTPQPKVVTEAIDVQATSTSKGPAATIIRIQVNQEELDDALGEGTETQRAFAVVPTVVDGQREWKEEDLRPVATIGTSDAAVRSFDATVQGPSDASTEGVDVFLETSAGKVSAQNAGEHRGVRQADMPEPHSKRDAPRKT